MKSSCVSFIQNIEKLNLKFLFQKIPIFTHNFYNNRQYDSMGTYFG